MDSVAIEDGKIRYVPGAEFLKAPRRSITKSLMGFGLSATQGP